MTLRDQEVGYLVMGTKTIAAQPHYKNTFIFLREEKGAARPFFYWYEDKWMEKSK